MRVLVVAGSSGGHIFPALSFLDKLNEKYKNFETLLVLPKTNIVKQIGVLKYRVAYLSVSSIKLSFDFKSCIRILSLFKAALETIWIMIKFRPDVVIGFGSLVSIPVVMLAWLFRIKILIHEQNVIPGRANRFLIRFSDKAAITFSETEDYFKGYQRKLVLTGNPLRKELSMVARNKALDFFSFANDKFTIFVMGGSSGSNRINSGFLKAIRTVSDRDKLQIVHLTGLKDYDLLKDKYKDLQVNIRLFKFLEAIEYAYSVADLVISRAGANAITEIIFFKLPAIIIPYPYAYRHQLSNAKILESIDSGIIIQDRELDTDILRKTIDNLINNPGRIEMMRSAYDKIHRPNSAADLLVNTALSLN